MMRVSCGKLVIKKASGATPTTATFRSRFEGFDTGKDGYLWLVEQFKGYRTSVLDDYLALHSRAGTERYSIRFARNPLQLFPPNSTRRGDRKYFATLTGGWFADTNLNHRDKFSTLVQLSHLSGLEYPIDWNFQVLGSTAELRQQQKIAIREQKLLAEIARL